MQVSALLAAAVEGHGHQISKLGQKALPDTRAKETDARGALEQPNTPKPREDKPSRSVKLLLRLLGTLKKKQNLVLLTFPDSQVTARGGSARQKLLPEMLGQSWGHRKSAGRWGAPTWGTGELQSCSRGCCGLKLRFSGRKSFDAPKNPWDTEAFQGGRCSRGLPPFEVKAPGEGRNASKGT